MTDTVNSWIEERRAIHAAATDGPWYKTPNDRILSKSVQWPEGDDYDVAGGFGRDGAVVEAIHDFDGNAIVDAHTNLPRALDALDAVLKMHHRETVGTLAGDVADGCSCGMHFWPCPTVHAIKEAITGAPND